MGSKLEFGDRFIQRVYILTICLTVSISIVLLFLDYELLLSFLIGSIIGLSILWSIEFFIKSLVKPGKTQKTKYLLGFIALGKYTIIGLLFYFLFRLEWINTFAFAGGIILVQGSIIILAIGLMVNAFKGIDPDEQ
ncbi:ATP synthase subunit I [Candidatus Poribacteria bacterium]|nr:ATP synthase subunit I [Candidatus Poribacteria bacterium]